MLTTYIISANDIIKLNNVFKFCILKLMTFLSSASFAIGLSYLEMLRLCCLTCLTRIYKMLLECLEMFILIVSTVRVMLITVS